MLLAGVDFPEEEERLHAALAGRGWAARLRVGNDTFAVLRAGTESGWGVAITCGAGINCVGVGPTAATSASRRSARSPATGAADATSAWPALWAAARSEDGRGPRTALERLVPAHFGYATPRDVAHAMHVGELAAAAASSSSRRVVLESNDAVGARDRRPARRRGRRVRARGGQPARSRGQRRRGARRRRPDALGRRCGCSRAIERGLRDVGPASCCGGRARRRSSARRCSRLDELGAGADAQERLREELGAAVERLETTEVA